MCHRLSNLVHYLKNTFFITGAAHSLLVLAFSGVRTQRRCRSVWAKLRTQFNADAFSSYLCCKIMCFFVLVEKGTPRGVALFTPWSGGRDCGAAYR
jgi:hypothetical protein